jgi:hypothetical protein
VRAQSGPVGGREKAFPPPSDAIPPTGKAFCSPQKEFHGRADEILPRKNDLIAREKETKPRFPFFSGDSPEGKRPSPEGKRPSPAGKRPSPAGKTSPPSDARHEKGETGDAGQRRPTPPKTKNLRPHPHRRSRGQTREPRLDPGPKQHLNGLSIAKVRRIRYSVAYLYKINDYLILQHFPPLNKRPISALCPRLQSSPAAERVKDLDPFYIRSLRVRNTSIH